MIRATYKNDNCKVNHQGYLSKATPKGRGLKQGCVLSPGLFNICLNKILEKTITTSKGIPWEYFRRKRPADLEYTDDICLLSYSINDMRRMIHSLEQEAESIGLKINVTKTKMMIVGNTHEEGGIYIWHEKGESEEDIQNRMKKGKQVFRMLNNTWTSTQISRKTKISIFNSNINPVPLCGCESWAVSKKVPKPCKLSQINVSGGL